MGGAKGYAAGRHGRYADWHWADVVDVKSAGVRLQCTQRARPHYFVAGLKRSFWEPDSHAEKAPSEGRRGFRSRELSLMA